jgi:hypothetical protein
MSIWKILPAFMLGNFGVYAQTAASSSLPYPVAAQPKPQMEMKASAMPCGVNENLCCFARGCENMYGIAIEGDFIWWRAENPGFVAAYEQKDQSLDIGVGNNVPDVGSIIYLGTEWAPGFRVGAGWNTNYDRWDVFADWTWFHYESSKTRTFDNAIMNQGFSFALYHDGHEPNPFKTFHAQWHMQFNMADLELGRAYYITKEFSLRPHWGARGGWINQKFNDHLSTAVIPGGPDQLNFDAKNDYWGVGPRIGLQGNWHIYYSNWSILGKAAGSLLYGKTSTHFKNAYHTPAAGWTTDRDMKSRFVQIVPNVQLFLGLSWGSCLNCNQMFLGIDAGWESNYYWNQFNVPMVVGDWVTPILPASTHAVTLEGLTVNAHLDF